MFSNYVLIGSVSFFGFLTQANATFIRFIKRVSLKNYPSFDIL